MAELCSRSSVPRLFCVVASAVPAVGSCQHQPASEHAVPPPSTIVQPAPLGDEAIAATILRYLKEERRLGGQNVPVGVTRGIANLDGTVTTLAARESAGAVAATIRGVRSVVNRISVDPPARDDGAIQSDLARALHHELAEGARSIDVRVHSGSVTLSGTTDSWQERALIEGVTRSVPGVRALDDQIGVRSTTARPDAEIAAEVRQRLGDDAWLDGATIAVTVKDGSVRLAGVVASFGQKVQAGSDAWVSYVNSVDDSGVVVDWSASDRQRLITEFPLRSDAEVARAVRDAFKYDPRLGALPPAVSVRDGMAVLTGKADSARARRAADEDAEATVGVWAVRDEILVTPGPPPTDADIDRAVEDAVSGDVFLAHGRSIRVSTVKGTVRLLGTVASGNERCDAVKDARAVQGVVEVDDQLTVPLPANGSSTTPPGGQIRTSQCITAADFPMTWCVSPSDAGAPMAIFREELGNALAGYMSDAKFRAAHVRAAED